MTRAVVRRCQVCGRCWNLRTGDRVDDSNLDARDAVLEHGGLYASACVDPAAWNATPKIRGMMSECERAADAMQILEDMFG